jgi:RNA polymerase sigma-70 factor, ECF subfamily
MTRRAEAANSNAVPTPPNPVDDDGQLAEEADLAGLLLKVAEGDRNAYRTLYDRSAGLLLRAARRILGDQQLAEDAVQDAFLRIWRRANTFDPERGGAKAWMGRIVRNASFDRLPTERDPRRIELVETVVLPVEPMSAMLRQCLETLPLKQRDAIILMYVHGMTHAELADHLGAPIGTVKSWVKRGSNRLRLCMDVEK